MIIALANTLKLRAKKEAAQNRPLAPQMENPEKFDPQSPSGSGDSSQEIIRRHTSPLPPTSLRNEFNSEGDDASAPPVPLRRTATGSTRTNRPFKDLDTVHERDENPPVYPVGEFAGNVETPVEKVEPAKDSLPVEQYPQDQKENPILQSETVDQSVPAEMVIPIGEPKPDTVTLILSDEPQKSSAGPAQPLSRHGTDAPPPTPSTTSPKIADAQDNENGLQLEKQLDKVENAAQPLLPRKDEKIASGLNST